MLAHMLPRNFTVIFCLTEPRRRRTGLRSRDLASEFAALEQFHQDNFLADGHESVGLPSIERSMYFTKTEESGFTAHQFKIMCKSMHVFSSSEHASMIRNLHMPPNEDAYFLTGLSRC